MLYLPCTGHADGVIRVPHELEQQVLSVALEIEAAEDRICAAAEAGMRLDEADRSFDTTVYSPGEQ